MSGHERGRRAAAFASGGVLVVGAVAALHNLYRSGDDAAELIAWSGLLLLALTALGGGIKLAMWGARPVIAALFDRAKERLAEPVLAVVASGAVIVGALGMWWTFRGGYAGWWQQVSGEHRWTLLLGVGQMLVAVAAGAALFTGGRYVTGLARESLTESGLLIERDRAAGRRRAPEGLWHPGLVAALVGGGLALVVMTAWLTPKVGPTIVGANTLAAVAAIVAVLVWGVGANLGWWKGLAGLWKWATDASHKAAATSGVVALLMFSAGGLGLGWFTPATVPQAHAQCPPDCGGGSNGSGSYGPDASQFQPPQMPGQMPDYQGGINQPALDQNGSISIYNTQAPSVSNNGVQGSSGQQGPQQSWDQPAHGTQIPDYQNAAPYTQGPGRPNPDFNPGSDAGSQGGQPNQGAQQPVQQPQQASQQPPQPDAGQQPNQSPNQSSDQQKIDDLTRQLQDQQQLSSQDRQRIDDLTKQLQQGQQRQNGNQKLPKAPSRDKKQDDKDKQDRDDQSGDNDLSALLLGAASTRRRKQDEQDLSDQQQPQGPDTQALAQDGAQLGQSLPGDIANTVSDSVNLGQSAGSAAQNFGSAAQAGASLASGAQSGAVNPMDAVALVQGVSGGISDTADAVGSGVSIASTWLNNAGQGAQLAADANPQLKAEAEQVQQLTQAGSQVADLTGQVAGGVSQVSGMVNTVSSLGASGMPDTSGVGDATDALSGTATAVNGPGDVPKPPTPPSVPSQSPSSVQALDSTTTRAPQQPPQPSNPSTPKTANQSSTPKPLSPLEASTFPAPLQALNTAQAASTPDPNAGRLSSMPGVRDVSQPPLRPAPTLQPDQVDAFRAITRQNLENQNVPADQIEQRVNDAVKQAQTPRFMPDPQPMRTPGAQPLDRPLGDKFNDVMGRANDRAYDDIDGLGQLGKNLTGQGGPGAPGVAESWKDLGTNTVKGLPDAVGGGFVADGKRLYEEPGNFIGDKMVELPLAAVSVPLGGEGAAIERGVLGRVAPGGEAAASRLTVDEVMANPQMLAGKTPQQVQAALGDVPGWQVESLGKGSQAGNGWVLRQYNEKGNPTGPQIRWHPGGGHHGPDPYWRVVGPQGDLGGVIR
ncbi:YhgE/Pip domain-containing protein [Mycobacteroides abscessus]|uniref:hypothetical protein n=1 Tax=Mycobacteroides abscessus TaxID=36809 RepID=UPI001F15D952|nr:hypothetical protein [Mycobacteroides abscessus]